MRFQMQLTQLAPEERACLDGFSALSDGLRRAILAIGANDSSSLAEFVGTQTAGAAALRASLSRFEQTGAPSKAAKARMLRSAQELAALNEEYAALIAHSADSLRLLAVLHGPARMRREANSWQA